MSPSLRMLAALVSLGAAESTLAQGPRLISKPTYHDRLRAMWLAECIANWTGLKTEGRFIEPPFLTDDSWGMIIDGYPLTWVYWQNPWLADDDTDIEYVHLHMLNQWGHTTLTAAQLAQGWQLHINDYIWVANARARELIGRGVLPPATGLATANQHWLMIDAQLTTELFGAISPGMPDHALALADLPIRTVSAGYATHAAQFYVVLYSLASQVDPDMPWPDKAIWLVNQARRWIPDSSKSADIADFVLADYLDNPDKTDWERTRDRVADRYQLHAAENGFQYRAWYESSVNFASGLIALLYGGGDFKRTVQIGALTGWDSDNGTATMGGLLGLMQGYDTIAAQFPGETLSDTYNIYRTRDNLPDYLPDDQNAEDTFALMAARLMPITERAILERGGLVQSSTQRWLLPPALPGATDPLDSSPTTRQYRRSANCMLPLLGGTVTATSSTNSNPPNGRGTLNPAAIANGFELDFSGVEPLDDGRVYYSSQGGTKPGEQLTLTVTYSQPVQVHTVRFIEGDHFDEPGSRGGYFASTPAIELLIDGQWIAPVLATNPAPDQARPFEILDYALATPTAATGIRLRGQVGGQDGFATCAELDALSAPTPLLKLTFDLNADGRIDFRDPVAWKQAPIDLDGDGDADAQDQTYLAEAVLWSRTLPPPEKSGMSPIAPGGLKKAPAK